MPEMTPCAGCGTHVRPGSACPHCGLERLRAEPGLAPSGGRLARATAAALALGLLGACNGASSMHADYGTPCTDSCGTETETGADTGADTGS